MERKNTNSQSRGSKTLKFISIIAIVFIGLGMSTSPVLAETITVDDNGGSNVDFTKIQPAIDNSTDGDKIIVNSGDYKENLTITKNITITTLGSDAFLNGTNMTGRNLSGIHIGKNAEPTIIGLDIRDFPIGVDGLYTEGSWKLKDLNILSTTIGINTSRAKGSWSLENVTVGGSFVNINANETTGKWKIEDSNLTGSFLSMVAAESTNNWTIKNSVIERSLLLFLASNSTGDWKIKDTVFRFSIFSGVVVTGTTGDWLIENTKIKNMAGNGLAASRSSGDWTINDSVIENITFASPNATVNPPSLNGTGVFTNGTKGNWSIHYTVFRNIAAESINASGAVFEGNATLNWWGSSSGPSTNDCVGNVDCSNWLTALPEDVSQSILNVYNTNGKPGIQRSEVKRAIQCYLFSQNCIRGKLDSSQIQTIIRAYLFS